MCSQYLPKKASLLFEECIEIADPEKRREYLDDACKGNPKLRELVESLLKAHDESGGFLTGGSKNLSAAPEGAMGSSDFRPGDVVGKYRLMGLIGEGSTSTVFLAEQEEPIHRWVALKVVKAGMDTRKVILRFGMERQALALMDHPSIAKLLDAGETNNGRPFFVMELVSGTGITYFCDENHLNIPERLQLFIEVCNAVFHAHQRGIIHRDLKPDNILVSKVDDRIVLKIVDFGIAKVLHSWGTDNGTQTGMMPFLGTPAYMSPEQVQLTSTALDTRTDIYSLGVLLYELLIGHPPFDQKYLLSEGLEEMCRIIRTEEPLAPTARYSQLPESERLDIARDRQTNPIDLQRKISGDLDWIILKALEKSRDRRYNTASSLAKDIRNFFQNLPVTAARPSYTYKLGKLVKRQKKLFIAGGAAAALLLISTIMIFTMGIKAKIHATKARNSELAAMAAEHESNESMVAMHVASGISASRNSRPDQALLWFAHAARLSGEKGLPTDAHIRRAAFWMSESSIPVGAMKLPGPLKNLEFSDNSKYLLAVGDNGEFVIWDTIIRKPLSWTTSYDQVENIKISPSGNHLSVIMHDGEACVVETSSGKLLQSHSDINTPILIQYSNDSQYVHFGDPHHEALKIDDVDGLSQQHGSSILLDGNVISTNKPLALGITENGWANVYSLEDQPDNVPAFFGTYAHINLIRPDSCSSHTNYREEFLKSPISSDPMLMRDGSRLLTRTGSYEVSLWDTATKNLVQKIENACCSCGISTNPESNLVACGLQGGIVGIWDVVTGEQKTLLPSQGSCLLDIDFGMQGKQLATVDVKGMARIWDINETKQVQPPMHHCTDVDSVAYSNNGKLLATAQADGLVRIWKTLIPVPSDSHQVGSVPTIAHMSSDGKSFVLTRDPAWMGIPESCIRFTTIYSTVTGRPLGTTADLEGCVEVADFSYDSSILALGVADCETSSKGKLEFYNLKDPKNNPSGINLPSAPEAIAYSPTEYKVAVLCSNGEMLVGKPGADYFERWAETVPPGKTPHNVQLAFTKDGSQLISLCSEGTIHVRDSSTGLLCYNPLRSSSGNFWSVALSADGEYLAASTTSGMVAVWDLKTGTRKGTLPEHSSWVYRCNFNPDGNLIVTTSHDGYVRVWDWRKGVMISEPMQHPGEVYDAAFTPDNRWLLTACRDGNLRIFDPYTGYILTSPLTIGQQAFNIEISNNGKRAIIGNYSNKIHVLSLELLSEVLPFGIDEIGLWGEVISSSTIKNGNLQNLTTSEWLEKFDRLMSIQPNMFHSSEAFSVENLIIESMPIITGKSLSYNDAPTGNYPE